MPAGNKSKKKNTSKAAKSGKGAAGDSSAATTKKGPPATPRVFTEDSPLENSGRGEEDRQEQASNSNSTEVPPEGSPPAERVLANEVRGRGK